MTAQAAVALDSGPDVLERTRALIPLLRENALRIEHERRVAPENIEALAEAGVFRLTLPRSLGGDEATVATQIEVLAEIARGCGSTSWVASVYSVGTWLAALFPDEAQDEVFATPDVRITVVATPTAVARPAEGGYRVTGKWAFNTGCFDAHWAFLGAMLEGRDDSGGHVVVLIPYSELEIVDDWYAPLTHLQVGEAAMKLDSAELHARRCAELVDRKASANEAYTVEERALVRMDLGWVTGLARDVALILQDASGATSIHEWVPIQRVVRDIQALALHGILNPKTNLELYGRVLCGLEPNTFLL